jgi:hypothetical protein
VGTEVPDQSVLSKARARWGSKVFEQLFVQTVNQCVAAALVNGRLRHIDSALAKAQAGKDSVVASGPELVIRSCMNAMSSSAVFRSTSNSATTRQQSG